MKIKATVVTGFLGAGKTTFINGLVQNTPEKRFALVENEFGEVSIDTKLIGGVDAGKMFELKNGCICCTITNEYELILLELAKKFPDTEHLIIETTGVADPVSVIKPFLSDPETRNFFQYNGTIAIVDAENYNYKPSVEITEKQIAIADKILISKTQNISDQALKKLVESIRLINPFAEPELTDQYKYDITTNIWLKKSDSFFSHNHTGSSHQHLEAITITSNQPFDKNEFTEKMAYNLDVYKQKIFRVKGIVYFKDNPFRHIVQGVGGTFEVIEDGISIGKEQSELVFFGELKGLTGALL